MEVGRWRGGGVEARGHDNAAGAAARLVRGSGSGRDNTQKKRAVLCIIKRTSCVVCNAVLLLIVSVVKYP